MAGAKFQYDESGGTFFYFLLSFEALVVLPCTYYFYPRDIGKNEQKRDKSQCHCDHCEIKNSRLRAKEPWRKAKQRFIKFLFLIGWTSLILTFYKVAHLQHDYVAYDPFEILEISPAATMPEIKKAYRKLSLVYHPDKESGDEKKFMMIAKAYAALTDEEARKNWEMYGNPDGPGATSFGIALPSWIVEKENSFLVLGLYALVFMVALPVAVGIWWYRSVRYNGDEVLLDTTRIYYFFLTKTPYMNLKRVIMVLAASSEFENNRGEIVERPSDDIEVPELIKELPNLGEKRREKILCINYSIKARALMHAHLYRMKLPPNTLDEDRLNIVKKCPYLLYEFVQNASQLTMLALAGRVQCMPHLDTIENAMKLCPMLVQAVWDNKSPLLQLPHITDDILRHFITRKRNIRNIHNLASMKSDDRRAMLRSLSDDQYDDVMNVIAKMPIIEVKIRSEVLDDEDSCIITAGAIVTVTATLIRKNMSILFDQELCHENGPVERDEPEENENNVTAIPNGDISAKAAAKSWKKSKKKKGTRRQPKKKKSTVAAGGKAVSVTSNAKLPVEQINGAPPVEVDIAVEKAKTESNESNSESDSETESVSTPLASGEEYKSENNEEDAEWEKFQQKISKKEKILETKSKKSHHVHCPYFPEEKEEFWWVYLAEKKKRAEKKKHALITIPYLVTNLVEEEEVELKFTAPQKPGVYTYLVVIRSDSYVDFDVVKTIKFDVKEAKEIDLTRLLWDVSEEEEEKDEEESAVEDSDLATDDEEVDDE